MGAMQRSLQFSFTVEKSEHWSAEHLAQCEQDDQSAGYDDWVSSQLEAVMRAVGEKFIAEHPDLFRG